MHIALDVSSLSENRFGLNDGVHENPGHIINTFRNRINTITVPVESLVMFKMSFVGGGTQISVLRPYKGSITIIGQIGEM